MYVKPCASTFVCVLALGLAVSSHAQSTDTVRSHAQNADTVVKPRPAQLIGNAVSKTRLNTVRPMFLTLSQAFNTSIPVSVIGTNAGLTPPKSFASTTLYQNFPAAANIGNNNFLFRFTAPAAPLTASAFLDDFDLPDGVAGKTGTAVSDFTFLVRNDSGADHAPGAAQDAYAVIKFYDTIAQTQNPGDSVTINPPLAEYDVKISSLGVAERRYVNVFIPASNPLILTRDFGNQPRLPDTYTASGFEIRFFDDAAHTIPSRYITTQFPLNSSGPQIGYSSDVIFTDAANTGVFYSGGGASFGSSPSPANLILQINGTPVGPLTYSIAGALTITGDMTVGLINVNWLLHPHSAGISTASDSQIFGSVTLGDLVDAGGATIGETGNYLLPDNLAPDTYDVTISPAGLNSLTIPNVAINSQNAYGVNATISASINARPPVTGTVALEGVSDLSAVSVNALLGMVHVSFRPPGTTTEYVGADVPLTATAGSPDGAFSMTGVPNGTYDVWIKGPKSLAVLVPNVTISDANQALPKVTLPAGDANNDNSVDVADFGVLVGAYNGDSAVAGTGYDAKADFNFDGVVDVTDFSLLVGEYGSVGAN